MEDCKLLRESAKYFRLRAEIVFWRLFGVTASLNLFFYLRKRGVS